MRQFLKALAIAVVGASSLVGGSVKAQTNTAEELTCHLRTNGGEKTYECVNPQNDTKPIVLTPRYGDHGPTSPVEVEKSFVGLSYESGDAQYGLSSNLRIVKISDTFSFSLRPSVHVGINKDKLKEMETTINKATKDLNQSIQEGEEILQETTASFNRIEPHLSEVRDEIEPLIYEHQNSSEPSSIDTPPSLSFVGISSTLSTNSNTSTSNTLIDLGLSVYDESNNVSRIVENATNLQETIERFENGAYDPLIKEEHKVEDYLNIKANAVATVNYDLNNTITLFAGGGYSVGFFAQESATLATVGADLYVNNDFALSISNNHYLFKDGHRSTVQTTLGITF